MSQSFEHGQFSAYDIQDALDYVDEHWLVLEKYNPHDDGTLIGLPHPYIVPSRIETEGFGFEELYYWDSYFVAQGLFGTAREQLAFDLLDDLLALFNRFHIIPNGSRFYFTSRSQPPLLTSFIMDAYHARPDKVWLEKAIAVAKEEYRWVWMSSLQPNWRNVFKGLSRYFDANMIHELAEAESGWDMNPRFDNKCLDFIPVDLNAMLYKYEKDFEQAATILGETEEAKSWNRRSYRRRAAVDHFLWNEKAGFYFDYNYVTGQQSKVWSLAGYFPLWAGMVSPRKAERLVKNLKKFEHNGGLATTNRALSSKEQPFPRQWAYPNGWAPLHFIVAKGLDHYGYRDDLDRVVRKWLGNNLQHFQTGGTFLEKYNVVNTNKPPKEGLYPSQHGFGWTNAIFYRLATDYLRPQELPQEMPERPKPKLVYQFGLNWAR